MITAKRSVSPHECLCVNPEAAVASALRLRTPVQRRRRWEPLADAKPFALSMLLALSGRRGVKFRQQTPTTEKEQTNLNTSSAAAALLCLTLRQEDPLFK